ncbi:MAG: Smr/MutS family protein, partial [Bacteroidales bacterium]|nr:Smr/MutS family protein [Bacteroidales bacterium]
RRNIEEFRGKIEKPADLPEAENLTKTDKLISQVKKLKIKKEKEFAEQEKNKDGHIKPGDAVRMVDTQAVGEVVGLKDKIATVETDSLRISVPLEKLEKISRTELRKTRRESAISHDEIFAISERKLTFKPDIDIRGYRVEEALNRVRELIDDAIMLQYRNLRILHGKGDGILQQAVRQYLSTVDVVKSFRDEHIDLGGSGITVVELDF